MKNFLLLIPILLFSIGCSSQQYMDTAGIQEIIRAEEFTFMATKANATNQDVLNTANSLPHYGASRMMSLDYGYTLTIKDKELTATLPYFGRLYTANAYDTDKQSLRFTSKDYTIQKSTTKKGNQLLRITPNDVSHIRTLNLEIYKNGKAFLSVDANDRQPISFDGYMMKNEAVRN